MRQAQKDRSAHTSGRVIMGLFANRVHLIDLHCYKPPTELKFDAQEAYRIASGSEMFSEKELKFMSKINEKSGLSPTETHLPKAINPLHVGLQPNISIDTSMVEARMCLFGAVEGLLKKTGLKASDVDILITCCSIFCPTPSMSSMIVNEFKMRPTVLSYHLGGMGCSMGVVSVNLIRDLLKAHPNSNAILVTTETTTPAYYTGTERSRLVTNCLFRMGAAAVLFSNKTSMIPRAKYELKSTIRIHQGYRDEAFSCIRHSPDENGVDGIYLGKDVVSEASRGLSKALTIVAVRVLDIGQILRYLCTEVIRKWHTRVQEFSPSFGKCLDHVLIHAGGAKVLEGIGKELQLTDHMLAPSYSVLWNYGNVSSSTTWYTLSNIESLRGVEKGDTIMQVGVGSGVKCGVNLWRARRDVHEVHDAWKHVWDKNGRVKEASHAKRRTRMPTSRLLLQVFLLIVFIVLALYFSNHWRSGNLWHLPPRTGESVSLSDDPLTPDLAEAKLCAVGLSWVG